jgi:hypothetical protein
MRILVTDAQELTGLGAVRSLGRASHEVTAPYPAGPCPAATWSRGVVPFSVDYVKAAPAALDFLRS